MQEEIHKDSGCKFILYELDLAWHLVTNLLLLSTYQGIHLDTLIKFNRLKILSTDYQVIIDALKSSTSQLLEVNTFHLAVVR